MVSFSLSLVSFVLYLTEIHILYAQSNPGCQINWSYYAKSNKCIKLFGFGSDGVSPQVWSKAEEYCNRFNDGHLAALESEDEITFVVKLTHAAGYDNGGDTPVHIGLSYNGASAWERPDGSSLAYVRWYRTDVDMQYLVGQYPAGVLLTRRWWTGYMWVDTAAAAFPFACQATPATEG